MADCRSIRILLGALFLLHLVDPTSCVTQTMGYAQVMGMAEDIRDVIKARICSEAKAGGEGCKANFGKGLTEALGKVEVHHEAHNMKTELGDPYPGDVDVLAEIVTSFFQQGMSSVQRSANRFMGLYDTYQRDGAIAGQVTPVSANPPSGSGVALSNVTGPFTPYLFFTFRCCPGVGITNSSEIATGFTVPVSTSFSAFNIQNKESFSELSTSQQYNARLAATVAQELWVSNFFTNAGTSWQFFGGPDGTYVQYPAHNNNGEYFDVRTQKWFYEVYAIPSLFPHLHILMSTT